MFEIITKPEYFNVNFLATECNEKANSTSIPVLATNQPSTSFKNTNISTHNYFRIMNTSEQKDEMQNIEFKIQLATVRKTEAEAELAELKLKFFKQEYNIE